MEPSLLQEATAASKRIADMLLVAFDLVLSEECEEHHQLFLVLFHAIQMMYFSYKLCRMGAKFDATTI
jgi:hypothetical protein